jgi:AraC-like DNA-binding protein
MKAMNEYSHEFAYHIFHTPTQLEQLGGIVPIRSGYNEAKPNYNVGPRIIFYYSFHFILSGAVEFICDNKKAILSQGDLFVLLPHKTHQYFISSDVKGPLRMFWIAVDGRQLPYVLRRLGITPQSPYVASIVDPDLHSHLFQFAEEWEKQAKQDNLALTMQLYSLFNRLILKSKTKAPDYATGHWLDESLKYIHLYYTEGISVKDISDYLGVHRVHFSNMFYKKMNIRPQQYIKKMLMEKALALIENTPQPITQIALTLGFSDLYSFTHSFKTFFGKPPSAFRKQSEGPASLQK